MKLKATFYLLNYDFSPEFAESNYDGKPSENNRYYDWEDELALTNEILEIKTHREADYFLMGQFPDGKKFNEKVPNMLLFECIGQNGESTWLGCSESIIDSYEIITDDNTISLTVTMAENEPLSNPVPGIYIGVSSFPKSLIIEEN